MNTYNALLFAHGSTGAVALATFWTAGLSKKGSPLHKSAGKIYLLAMAAVLVIALPLAVSIMVSRSTSFGVFLLLLFVITTTNVWISWRAIRDQRNWQRFTGPVYHTLAWLNLLGAAVIVGVALALGGRWQFIFMAFAAIGVAQFFQMRRFWRTPPANSRWWFSQHMNGMIGNGVATHVAFLNIGLPKLFPLLAGAALQYLAWLGPLAAAFAAGWYLRRKFPKPPEVGRHDRLPAAKPTNC
jgi:hypothetical protein